MLFIDGDHELPAVEDAWDAWTPWVRDEGIVALHDSNPSAPWFGADYGPVQWCETPLGPLSGRSPTRWTR